MSETVELEFTRDPEWKAKREKLWKSVERQVAEGLSRKVYNRWKTFFFTGELIGEGRLDQGGLFEFYPKFDLEGMQDFLASPPFQPVTSQDYTTIQSLFAIRIHDTPGVSLERAVALFTHVFGERYDPGRRFPFDIAGESERRKITLHHNLMFEYGTSVFLDIKNPKTNLLHWFKLLDYWFSLIPFVDNRFFDTVEDESRIRVDGGVMLDKVQIRLRQIMRWTFEPHPAVADHPYKEVVLEYLGGFRDRMGGLSEYPGQLEELWHSIQKEYV